MASPRLPKTRVLPRIVLGDPLLRRKAKRVTKAYLASREFRVLERDLIQTMRSAGGVGLAAPQVGVPLRVAVMEMHPTELRPGLAQKGPLTIVNPRIVDYGTRIASAWEGCLSFSPLRGRVPRPTAVTVEYQTSDGEIVRESATGLWARIFQHEIDHLNGILYVDRVTDTRSYMELSEYRKRIIGKN